MKVAKWGNSLAIRLPAAVVEALALNEGDEIESMLQTPPISPWLASPAATNSWRASAPSGAASSPTSNSTDDANARPAPRD